MEGSESTHWERRTLVRHVFKNAKKEERRVRTKDTEEYTLGTPIFRLA